jgi:hypothetical protein
MQRALQQSLPRRVLDRAAWLYGEINWEEGTLTVHEAQSKCAFEPSNPHRLDQNRSKKLQGKIQKNRLPGCHSWVG